ncbi:MAG: F0F1 ATP synthase subunit A [Micavibrio sp. TMED27]|nr:F0F1 ATP synthase subunit A [Micavibrio sp.]OUT90938.1 MAG: F0F1 ATP synthase subunit A [Micavibrio sp. TMED27]|tara:strand:+ start:628 stop:1383 length:756 start_codon:yes stop_codon:yes gene_type:complete
MAGPIDQFVIVPLVEDISIAGYDLSFTNSSLWMVIAAVTSIGFLTYAMKHKSLVPGRFQMFSEMIYQFVAGMIRENIGNKGREYFPLVFTIFMFVLMGNMLGMLPYSFTYTSHIIVTATLAAFLFALIFIVGIARHGTHFFSLFVPPGVPPIMMILIVPLEVISFIVRPITLSVRLFANMMAGHIVLKVFAGFSVALASLNLGGAQYIASLVPAFFNVALFALEFLVAFLQAYVFTLLTCIYLKDTVEIHH